MYGEDLGWEEEVALVVVVLVEVVLVEVVFVEVELKGLGFGG